MYIIDAILRILEYKFPDNSATAAHIAKITKTRSNWTEEDIEEYLWKLSNNIIKPHDMVEVVNTHPPTSPSIYKLVAHCTGSEEELEAFLDERN